MNGDRVERRLAAILAADAVAYSRLMGEDEVGTLARLKALRRELIDPQIAEHKGRLVKTTGDCILIEFASVVQAVACAVAIQRGIAERNAAIPEDKHIEFRVGIHQGDVIVEGDDLFSDGVNIAPVSKPWLSRVGFASRRGCRKTPPAGLISSSMISASRC
jgi:adenylate cyclase